MTIPYIAIIGPALVAWLLIGAVLWGRRYG